MRIETLKRNPFVPVSEKWRVGLVAYALIYRIFTPGLLGILYSGSSLGGGEVILEIIRQLLIFLPLFLYRPPKYGWLHPLLFPTFFSIAKSVVSNPAHLLKPMQVFSGPGEQSFPHFIISLYGVDTLGWAGLEYSVYGILSLTCYYAGFFFAERYTNFDLKPPHFELSRPHYVRVVAMGVVGVAFLVFLSYIQDHGGLNSYMLSYFGRGRVRARGEIDGTIFYIVGLGAIASLLWYALDPKARNNPLFWVSFVFVVPVNFFLTGSRSVVFITVAFFIIVWMIRHQVVPKLKVIVLGVLAVMLVGIMGEFRRSAYEGYMDWEVLMETNVEEALDATYTEMEYRENLQGGAPVIAAVPEEVDFLYGKSYVGAVLFFIPRFIWESKPHGVGIYNSELILKRGEGSGGVPVGPVGEAYWNFSVPGVVTIFFLFGIFHKGLARTLRRYSFSPVIWVLYTIAVLRLEPSSITFTTGVRDVLGAVVIATLMGAISLRSRK